MHRKRKYTWIILTSLPPKKRYSMKLVPGAKKIGHIALGKWF